MDYTLKTLGLCGCSSFVVEDNHDIENLAESICVSTSAGVAHVSRLVGLCRNRSVLSRLSRFFGCSDPVALC